MPIKNILSAIKPRSSAQTVAAVDLGSNSFHMILARPMNGQFQVIDRLQEMVRLAAGFDEHGNLDKPSRVRALECLARFGERLRGMPRASVRAVGTDTLRRAGNAAKFLDAAERALGYPIEIISGQEEARLIYSGAAHDVAPSDEHRLVIDIGGGSTEFVIGRRLDALLAESLHIGCVNTSLRFFPQGKISEKQWHKAETAARLELQPIEHAFRERGWKNVYGTAGTIRAVGAVVRGLGWGHGEITLSALEKLRHAILSKGHIAHLEFDGLSAERAPVFPGGAVVLTAAFRTLGIERMDVCDSALREGLLYNLLGRMRHTDVRARTIAALCERYNVDLAQAIRVERTAGYLFEQVARAWKLDEAQSQSLSFAARLHEIGLAIAHTKYHCHGAYLVEHSDLPGFSSQEQRLLATLVRGHRRRFPLEVFDELSKDERRVARRLTVLLRLAVLLHRGRHRDVELPKFSVIAHKRELTLKFTHAWLKKNPLTSADLAGEAELLRAAGYGLTFG